MLNVAHRPFDILAKVNLSEEQLDRLRVIEDYDLWFIIERVTSKGILSEHLAYEAVAEFKKYMALIALGHEDLGMHSSEVDEIWHNFILFTPEYAEFCKRICGHMIHHRPNTSRRPELPPASVPEFKEAYTTFFGALPPIWHTRKMSGANPTAHGSQLLPGDCDVAQDPPKVLSRSYSECDSTNAEPIPAPECDSQGEADSLCQSGTCDASLPSAGVGVELG